MKLQLLIINSGNPQYVDWGKPFTEKGESDKYSTVYNKKDPDGYYKDDAASDYIVGDATYETYSWNNDESTFMRYNKPFMKRGGFTYYGEEASGIFGYSGSYGSDAPPPRF